MKQNLGVHLPATTKENTFKPKHRSIHHTAYPDKPLDLPNWWGYIHAEAGKVHHSRVEHERLNKEINLR